MFSLNSKELAQYVADLTLEKKADNVKILNLENLTSISDYFVICSGDSEVQVKAISDHILDSLKDRKIKVWHKEGYQAFNWVLLDLIDVVVHIFKPDVREHYALEKFWGDAKTIEVKDES
jgi:ribosome-associated protein